MNATANILCTLIRHNTCNPGGDELGFSEYLASLLAPLQPDALDVVTVLRPESTDVPSRRGAYVFARWGTPHVLINAHLDTVPVNHGWTYPPHEGVQTSERVIGLGAADTKGAIACVLAALATKRPANLAVLFSGDEEVSGSCMKAFLTDQRFETELNTIKRAIVCEPTGCQLGVRHRGILAFRVSFKGSGGHSSNADWLPAPLVDATKIATALHAWGQNLAPVGPEGFKGMCLNIAQIHGGIAFNVVPQQAALDFSIRPPPTANNANLVAELTELARARVPDARVEVLHDFAPFATRQLDNFAPWFDLTLRQNAFDMSFWTEAALFAQRGIDAVVFGPGHIEQAHAPNEFVAIDELNAATALFTRIIDASC